jgi:hypothetical protein
MWSIKPSNEEIKKINKILFLRGFELASEGY